MLRKLAYIAIALLIYFVGMFVGQTQSPDATAVRQNGQLQSLNASYTAAFAKICADVDVQDKMLIQLGVPSSSVTLHCSANPFVSAQ